MKMLKLYPSKYIESFPESFLEYLQAVPDLMIFFKGKPFSGGSIEEAFKADPTWIELAFFENDFTRFGMNRNQFVGPHVAIKFLSKTSSELITYINDASTIQKEKALVNSLYSVASFFFFEEKKKKELYIPFSFGISTPIDGLLQKSNDLYVISRNQVGL